jgi:hypothetical protein
VIPQTLSSTTLRVRLYIGQAMSGISEFTDTERWTIQNSVDERWGKNVIELHLADVDVGLDPDDKGLTSCPAVFWHQDNCNFVVAKTGEQCYRCLFFYDKELEQLGTGIKEFNDIATCVVTLLQTQADHESVRSGTFPGTSSSS